MSEPAGHVLLVGDAGPAADAAAVLAPHVAVSWLAHLPAIAHRRPWPYRTVQGLHRDSEVAAWVTLARALAEQRAVSGVWQVGTGLANAAQAIAQSLGVPMVGGPLDRPGPSAPAARGDRTAGGTEFSVKIVRSGEDPHPLLVTRLQRHASSAAVIAEDGPHHPVPVHDLARWCAARLPRCFLGSVDFRIDEGGILRTGLRPWQPVDGLADLLAPRALDATSLAVSILTGAPVFANAEAGTDPGGVAVAAYGSEVAGTLVELEGLAAAAESPGVVQVTELLRAGDTVRSMADGGDLLLRVAAVADAPEVALRRAVAGLGCTAPVVDMVPDLAGALDNRWF